MHVKDLEKENSIVVRHLFLTILLFIYEMHALRKA
jgi:hypothetical protein